jgi:hypothetical protein
MRCWRKIKADPRARPSRVAIRIAAIGARANQGNVSEVIAAGGRGEARLAVTRTSARKGAESDLPLRRSG